MKIIYAIEPGTGLTYSRYDQFVAVPVQSKRNKFGTYDYRLMLFHLSGLGRGELKALKPTTDLPASIRHYHLQFWNNFERERKELERA